MIKKNHFAVQRVGMVNRQILPSLGVFVPRAAKNADLWSGGGKGEGKKSWFLSGRHGTLPTLFLFLALYGNHGH